MAARQGTLEADGGPTGNIGCRRSRLRSARKHDAQMVAGREEDEDEDEKDEKDGEEDEDKEEKEEMRLT